MIDKTDAPEGYEAVAEEYVENCRGCHFYDTGEASVICGTCTDVYRADNEDVIFKLINND